MTSLSGSCTIVTGASRGIGEAIAVAMAKAGARVALVADSDSSEVCESITRAGGDAKSYVADVSDQDQVNKLFKDVLRDFNSFNVLVNNAGVQLERPLLETDVSDFEYVMGTNARGTFLMGREGIRHMVKQGSGGRVINIASDLAYIGREQFSVYCASKAAVLSLTKSWAREFAPDILVNSICPGPIDTDMLNLENMSPEWRAKESDIPLKRIGQPEEISELAVFLAGPGSTFITGQGIGVNGGSVMP
ncbi:MAG: SDR family oxidoreductase [Pseudomonadota bacterium]|nr:SDR family oxidoreductase [Pseudomonadota bacterium]MED5408604.1 SDR family oxidoreductase [Pseudomonadota bacterium]